jgi:hypothetical protein
MMSHKIIAKSTFTVLLSVISIALLGLAFNGTVTATSAEPGLRAAYPLRQVDRLSVDAPEAAGTLTDTTVANFQAGLGCYIAPSAGGDLDGEVILTPTIGLTFTGNALPADWNSGTYDPVGAVTVSNGVLTAVGAYAATSATYLPSQTLEFSATFGTAASEHVGLAASENLNSVPWAIFSTQFGDTILHAWTAVLGSEEDTPLGSAYNAGTAHRYRIAWTGSSIVYSIDGDVVASHTAVTITDAMRPIVSSLLIDPAAKVVVDWLRMSPYAASCSFQSRVLDAGSIARWLSLTSIITQPAGTSSGVFQTRTGSTSTVDGSWSTWTSVSGTTIGSSNGRYIQYRVALTTTDPAQTPAVASVALSYSTLATPVITWTNPADIVYGTPLGAAQLNATASVPGTFVYTPISGTVLNAGAGQPLRADFTPIDTTNYTTATKTVAITVTKATPLITWSNPANIVYLTPLGAAQLNATASVPGTFVYTPISGTVLNAGASQSLHVDFTPTDSTNYLLALKDVTITVLRAPQTITFGALPDKVIGDLPFSVTASASSSLSVTFTASGDCSVVGNTVTLLKAGTCTVTAQQAGNTNYEPAEDVPQTFTIQPMKVYLPLIVRSSP